MLPGLAVVGWTPVVSAAIAGPLWDTSNAGYNNAMLAFLVVVNLLPFAWLAFATLALAATWTGSRILVGVLVLAAAPCAWLLWFLATLTVMVCRSEGTYFAASVICGLGASVGALLAGWKGWRLRAMDGVTLRLYLSRSMPDLAACGLLGAVALGHAGYIRFTF